MNEQEQAKADRIRSAAEVERRAEEALKVACDNLDKAKAEHAAALIAHGKALKAHLDAYKF